jgi:CheY-like chemotaxis protein
MRDAALLLNRASEEVLERGALRPRALLPFRGIRFGSPTAIPTAPQIPDAGARDIMLREPGSAARHFETMVLSLLGKGPDPGPGEAFAAAVQALEPLIEALSDAPEQPYETVAGTLTAAVERMPGSLRQALSRDTSGRPHELLRRVSLRMKARLLVAEALRGDPDARGFLRARDSLVERPEDEEELWPLVEAEVRRPGVPPGSLSRVRRLFGREETAAPPPSAFVVVVEPDVVEAERIAVTLRMECFEVFETADAEAALTRVRDHGADLLVLEPKLNGMHGLDLLGRIRRERKEPLPVLVHTNFESFRRDFEIATHPRHRFLRKPASVESLVAAARELLGDLARPRQPGEAPSRPTQLDLLPPRNVTNRHFLVAGFEVATFFHAAQAHGSTYFDVFPQGEDETAVFLIDGLGREGPGAEALRAVRSDLVRLAAAGERPSRALSELNALLHDRFGGRPMASALYAVVDARQGELRICHAGANGPLRFRRGAPPEELKLPSAVLLGFGKGQVFEASLRDTVIPLDRGDVVLFYSRGVPPGLNPEDFRLCRELVTRELDAALGGAGAEPRAEELARRLGDSLKPRQRADGDLGFVLLRRVRGAEHAGSGEAEEPDRTLHATNGL